MKHSLTALLLTLALFCCLLTGCGPTPDVPGGSEGSNGSSSGSTNSGTKPDDSNGGGVSAPKLQPSIVMESFRAYHDAAGEDVARCVFQATNPNTAYSVSRARVDLTLKDAAGNVQETTYFSFRPSHRAIRSALPIPTNARRAFRPARHTHSPARPLPASSLLRRMSVLPTFMLS